MNDTPKKPPVDGSSQSQVDNDTASPNANNDRRKAVRNILAGSGLTIGAASSGTWVKPAIDAVITPAHAQTSAVTGPVIGQVFAGNISLTPVVTRAVDTKTDRSILDFFIPTAHANQELGFELSGACVIVTVTSASAFTLQIQFFSGPPRMLTGSINGNQFMASDGVITFDAMLNFAVDPAMGSGTIANGFETFNFTISDDGAACVPQEPVITPVTTTPTTAAPTTTPSATTTLVPVTTTFVPFTTTTTTPAPPPTPGPTLPLPPVTPPPMEA